MGLLGRVEPVETGGDDQMCIRDRGETVLNVVLAALGPRLGERTQQVIAATRRGEWSRLPDGRVEVAGIALEPGEFDLRLRCLLYTSRCV